MSFSCCFLLLVQTFRLRLHEQIKPRLIAQILDPYEVTPDKFAQILKHVLFAHVNAASGMYLYCSDVATFILYISATLA